jgi:hypothetical protein
MPISDLGFVQTAETLAEVAETAGQSLRNAGMD